MGEVETKGGAREKRDKRGKKKKNRREEGGWERWRE